MATPADEQPIRTEPVPAAGTTSSNGVFRSIVERWKMENLEARTRTLLRVLAWFFSLLSLVIMASDTHGGSEEFDHYEEYNYCLAMVILAFLYTSAQIARGIHRLSAGRDTIPRKTSAIIDFAADQVVAYLLISGMSAATPVTDYMRAKAHNLFTDSAAASISMAFFAFLAIALSALISGYMLSIEALA